MDSAAPPSVSFGRETTGHQWRSKDAASRGARAEIAAWIPARPGAERSPIPRTVRGVLGIQASEDLVTWLSLGQEELRAGIRADLQADLKLITARLDAMYEKLNLRLHQLELRVAESKADLIRWSFVFWVGAVAAVAALAGVLRGL